MLLQKKRGDKGETAGKDTTSTASHENKRAHIFKRVALRRFGAAIATDETRVTCADDIPGVSRSQRQHGMRQQNATPDATPINAPLRNPQHRTRHPAKHPPAPRRTHRLKLRQRWVRLAPYARRTHPRARPPSTPSAPGGRANRYQPPPAPQVSSPIPATTPERCAALRPRPDQPLLRASTGHGDDDADHLPQARRGEPGEHLPPYVSLAVARPDATPTATTRPATTPPAPRQRPQPPTCPSPTVQPPTPPAAAHRPSADRSAPHQHHRPHPPHPPPRLTLTPRPTAAYSLSSSSRQAPRSAARPTSAAPGRASAHGTRPGQTKPSRTPEPTRSSPARAPAGGVAGHAEALAARSR